MKKINIILWITGSLTAIISGIMNFVLMPQIEATTRGIKCFDMHTFGYSYDTARKFLEFISVEGKNIYLNYQLPLDFVYPVIYTCFFVLIMYKLKGKMSGISVLPILLLISDYIENSLTSVMLKSEILSKSTATVGSLVTLTKNMLMYICFGIIIYLVIRYVADRKKSAPVK